MYCHDHFQLLLHDDNELAVVLQDRIIDRLTLHEWPLSCVQQLLTSGGRKFIYKSQRSPSVESEFYANATSSLIVSGQTIYSSNEQACILIEFVDGQLVKHLNLAETDAVRIASEVTAQIRNITGKLPHVLDITSSELWHRLIDKTLNNLRLLIQQDSFHLVSAGTLAQLERLAYSSAVLEAICGKVGYSHGDLSGDNLFVLDDGYRLIDWQFPKLAPADLDFANLLDSLGFNPLHYVKEGIVTIMHLLRICWLTECAIRWIPDGAGVYDEQIAGIVEKLNRANNQN